MKKTFFKQKFFVVKNMSMKLFLLVILTIFSFRFNFQHI